MTGAIVCGLLMVALPSCTIDFEAPFNETGWYAGGDAGGDVATDQRVEAQGDTSQDDASDAPDATDETGEAGLCNDGVLNGNESDVDCGGRCAPCSIGGACEASDDCVTEHCVDAVCCESACLGTCRACSEVSTGEADGTCADIKVGTDPDDECAGGYGCRDGSCESCTDGVQNGDETWIDCGGACPPCGEICTNGVDDDGNGLVDCEDPLCGSFACAPEAPTGWDGPVWLFAGTGAAPSCSPNDLVTTGGLATSSFPLATCTKCACEPPVGQLCSSPAVEFFDPSDCSGSADLTVNQPPPNTCQNIVDTEQYDSAWLLPQDPAGGSCSASGGLPTVEPFEWPEPALVCEADVSASGAGCSGGAACVPRPPAPYLSQLCFYRQGTTPCPGPAYDQYVVFSSWSDSRDCSPCTCSSPTGGTCGGTVDVYGPEGCAGSPTPLPNDGICEHLVGSTYFESLRYTPEDPSGGSCATSGGEPVGTVAPTGPTTVCCRP